MLQYEELFQELLDHFYIMDRDALILPAKSLE